MYINHEEVYELLEEGKKATREDIINILEKARKKKGISHKDIAALLQLEDKELEKEMFKVAGDIKKSIYGKRVVLFAPLYISDYCVNNCVYCGYKKCNSFNRRKLTQDEIKEEVKILEKMGHKRIALELGEDPVNAPIDYVLESLDTIYKTQNENGNIRRVNVNIAATTVENYKKLKDANIGTYILFQETYHKPTYEIMHPHSLKSSYEYHLNAFDRAMEAGIEDVGGGVLFGLSDPKFEVLSLMMHNEHLEKRFGVGFHTISVPRIRQAEGVTLENFPYLLSDNMFRKIVAIIRIAVPFTGIIMSTREDEAMRRDALKFGVTQVSSGSSTGVGGYKQREEGNSIEQFKTSDERTPLEVLNWLLDEGYIPSYCTACYRKGRTGETFMGLAKTGEIQNMCEPNALMTLMEYALDYGDEETCNKTEKIVNDEILKINNESIKSFVNEGIIKLKEGKRDIYI